MKHTYYNTFKNTVNKKGIWFKIWLFRFYKRVKLIIFFLAQLLDIIEIE